MQRISLQQANGLPFGLARSAQQHGMSEVHARNRKLAMRASLAMQRQSQVAGSAAQIKNPRIGALQNVPEGAGSIAPP